MRGTKMMSGLLAGSVLMLTMAASAMAGQPETLLRHDRLNTSFIDTSTCPGLEILSEAAITRTWTVYFDKEGNETRFVAQARYFLSSTNVANGVSLSSPGTRHIVFDSVRGTYSDTGVFRIVTASGGGVVLHQSGRWVEDLDTEELLSYSGPHQEYLGDLDAFCAALT